MPMINGQMAGGGGLVGEQDREKGEGVSGKEGNA